MDEISKYYAKSKKPFTKGCIFSDSIYTRCQNRQIHKCKKQISICLGFGRLRKNRKCFLSVVVLLSVKMKLWWWPYNCMHIVNTIELYTLTVCIVMWIISQWLLCIKNRWPCTCGSISWLSIYSITLYFFPMPIPNCLRYYNSIVNTIRYCKLSSAILLFKTALAVLHFCIFS